MVEGVRMTGRVEGSTLYSRVTGMVEDVRVTGRVEGSTLYSRVTGMVEDVRVTGRVEGVRMTGEGGGFYLVLQDDGVSGVLDGAFVETPLEVD